MTSAITVQGLGKRFQLGGLDGQAMLRDRIVELVRHPVRTARRKPGEELWALHDVSFDVADGEALGIIGHNGAGKSTLLKILARITEPTAGWAEVRGRVGSLLEVGTGFHPELTGRENVYLNGSILGMSRQEINSKFDEIVAFAGVERFLDTPVKRYSTGMHTRLAFSVAAHLEPEILLVDEVLAVGDAAFQKRCLTKMDEVTHDGRTVLFVSHNMSAIRALCRRGIVLHRGELAFDGPTGQAFEHYYDLIREAAENDDTPLGLGLPEIVGQPQGEPLAQGEPFAVSTVLHVPDGVAGFHIDYVVTDMSGTKVVHVRQTGDDLGIGGGAEGSYRIEVGVPPLWLAPGAYTLQFEVRYWSDVRKHRDRSPAITLDITAEEAGREALLQPRCEWRVDSAAQKAGTRVARSRRSTRGG